MAEELREEAEEKARLFEAYLLPLVRRGLGLTAPAAMTDVPQGEDFQALADLAERQGLAPLLWQGLQGLTLSDAQAASLSQLRLSFARSFLLLDIAERNACACLEKAGVAYLPLKGAVLRGLYPEPWLRTSADIDILVHEDDLPHALETLAENGFQKGTRNYHDVTLFSGGACLELHFSVREHDERLDPVLSLVWQYAQPVAPGASRHRMQPDFLLFHVLAHMSYHFSHGGLGIRPYLDLFLLEHEAAFDEHGAAALVEQAGLMDFRAACRALIGVWFGGEAHSDITCAMEALALGGGPFGSKTRAARHAAAEPGYLMRRVFVPREVLSEMYPRLRKMPFLAPLYQARRWLRLLSAEKQAQAVAELKNSRATPDVGEKAYQELLEKLNLK